MTLDFPVLALLGAGGAAALVPLVRAHLSGGPSDVSLKKSLRTELGLSDYLVYEELVDKDTVLTTYGGLGAIFELVWQDTSVVSDEEAIRHCAWLNDALRKLGAGWMHQSYTLRSDAAPVAMPSFVTSDAHRVLAESHVEHASAGRYETRHLVAFTFLPPTVAASKAKALIFSGESPIDASYERVRGDFERGLHAVEGSLARVARVRRLGEHRDDPVRNELLEAIVQILFDEPQPVRIATDWLPDPFEPVAIGGLLAARDVSPVGLTPKIGDKHLRVLSVYGLPGTTHPGMMEAFLKVPAAGCRFSMRSIFQDVDAAQAKLDFKRRSWTGQKTSLVSKWAGEGRVDRYAAVHEEKAEAAILAAQMGYFSWAHLSAKVVFLNEDLVALTAAVNDVRKALKSEGFLVNVESIGTFDAYLGHLPFDGFHDVREGQVHSGNIGRMWPSSSRWPGRKTWNCRQCGPGASVPALVGVTETGEPFYLDPHDDEDSQSFIAIAPPGSGKTTDLCTLAANYRRGPLDQVFGIDKNRGQYVTTMFLGGDYRDGERYALFDGIEESAKRAYLTKFLAKLAELNGVPIEARQRDILGHAIDLMVNDAPRDRSLSTLLSVLSPRDMDARMTEALAQYAAGGVHRGIFDAPAVARPRSNSYEAHELGGLLRGNQDDLVAAPVLLWVLHSFEARLLGHRSIILVDEAWATLKSPLVAAMLDDELRTMRYRHAGIGFFTHSLGDIKDSAIGRTVFAACKSRWLYPNPDAGTEFRGLYESLDLTSAQIDRIKNGVLKRDCNLSVNGKFGTFRLQRSEAELAVFGCTGADEIAAARRLIEEYPEDWRERFLRNAGCDKEADRLRSLRRQSTLTPASLREAISA